MKTNKQKLNNGYFSADFEGCKEHLVIENVLSTSSKIWESVKQAQKEQNVLVDGFALLLLPSFNNERRMTCKQLDKCQQLLQLDTLMDLLVDVF